MEQTMMAGPRPVGQRQKERKALPQWAYLTEQQQRELVVTLVGMVTQQLPSRLARQEASDER